MFLLVKVDKSIGKKLDNLSKLTHRTKSFYVKEALLNQLDNLENVYLDPSMLQDLKLTKNKILTPRDFWSNLEH